MKRAFSEGLARGTKIYGYYKVLRPSTQPKASPGGRYFDPGLAWNPRPIWRAGWRIVTSLFRVTSVVNTPFKSTSVVNTQIPVV